MSQQPANASLNSQCSICRRGKRPSQTVIGELVYPSIFSLVQKKHPDFNAQSVICQSCLDHFRAEYVEDVLETERGELTAIEQEVIDSFRDHQLFAENLNTEFDGRRTWGERVADRIAEFGGSWRFILLFGGFIAVWMGLNIFPLVTEKAFDPFPFILLNLVLSTLAAIQAPIIMMSQNRQAARDRMRSEFEYGVNLKAELEIRHLHRKMDQLLSQQWRRLLEIQRIQIGLMREILAQKNAQPKTSAKTTKAGQKPPKNPRPPKAA